MSFLSTPGLRAVWRGIERMHGTVGFGLVVAVAGGITLGLLTCFVYFLGLYLGLPLGFLLGAVWAWRRPAADGVVATAIALGTSAVAGALIHARGQTYEVEFGGRAFLFALTGLLAIAILPHAPLEKRQRWSPYALTLTWAFLIGSMAWKVYSV